MAHFTTFPLISENFLAANNFRYANFVADISGHSLEPGKAPSPNPVVLYFQKTWKSLPLCPIESSTIFIQVANDIDSFNSWAKDWIGRKTQGHTDLEINGTGAIKRPPTNYCGHKISSSFQSTDLQSLSRSLSTWVLKARI